MSWVAACGSGPTGANQLWATRTTYDVWTTSSAMMPTTTAWMQYSTLFGQTAQVLEYNSDGIHDPIMLTIWPAG